MKHERPSRTGLTLVEVLLAMAIMAMVLAALTQLQDSGARASLNAALVAEASVLCQSEMDAWLAGNKPLATLDTIQPVAGSDRWSRRVTVQPLPAQSYGSDDGLGRPTYGNAGAGLSLLTVEIFRGDQRQPQFTLSRWVDSRGPGGQP